MDKSERYLKEIAKNTADIVKELKKMNRGIHTIDVSDIEWLMGEQLTKEEIETLKNNKVSF